MIMTVRAAARSATTAKGANTLLRSPQGATTATSQGRESDQPSGNDGRFLLDQLPARIEVIHILGRFGSLSIVMHRRDRLGRRE